MFGDNFGLWFAGIFSVKYVKSSVSWFKIPYAWNALNEMLLLLMFVSSNSMVGHTQVDSLCSARAEETLIYRRTITSFK